jgi:hypothetical protein
VIVGGFIIVGSPARQRSLKFDDQRINDLQMIQSQTINYWQQKGNLPVQLNDLKDSISGFTAPMDPQTGQAYEYNVKSALNFELCANFNLPSQSDRISQPIPMIYPPPDNWQHAAGHVCFDRTIDPQLNSRPVPFK